VFDATQWKVPIDRASVEMIAPAAVRSAACYRGPHGSVQPCTAYRVDGATADLQDGRLGPGEGLTVRVGFPAGVVPVPQPVLQQRRNFPGAFALTPLSGGLAAVLTVLALLAGWLVLRPDVPRRPRLSTGMAGLPGTVEYSPPDNVPPALAGLLLSGRVRPVPSCRFSMAS